MAEISQNMMEDIHLQFKEDHKTPIKMNIVKTTSRYTKSNLDEKKICNSGRKKALC